MDRNASLREIKTIVSEALDMLYDVDQLLFSRRRGKGLHERCLQARFAHHLQNEIVGFFVDCEYDSSWTPILDENGIPISDENGNIEYEEEIQKWMRDLDGNVVWTYVDIIVHRRMKKDTDFFCFELKKWNKDSKKEREDDFNKLRQLTSSYHYCYGFYLVFGKKRKETKWTVFQGGEIVLIDVLV